MIKNFSNLGFRMPGEWEKQDSVWIVWPHNKKDWPGLFKNIPNTIAEIISSISRYQIVNLIVNPNENILKIKKILLCLNTNLKLVKFHKISTNRIWIRDFGPIYLINKIKKKKIFINFKFNGWSRYKNFKKDNKLNDRISKITKVIKYDPKINIKKNIEKEIILEGGAIDVNGNGSILLTKECLLSKVQQRNPGVKKIMYEKILSNLLNVKNFIWLDKGIKGDDTHGHIDDITRFVSSNTIMTATEKNKKDRNYKILKNNLNTLKKVRDINGKKFKLIKIPMPKPIYIKRTRVPASYLNFLICNKIVLLPLFNDTNDNKVLKIFKNFFKKRKIIGIDCSSLIWGFGAIHCMTQNEPSVAL